ncbi:MAG: hypothetical protein ACRD07_06760 [Acidimicrobiales bacterium]
MRFAIALMLVGLLACSDGGTDSGRAPAGTRLVEPGPIERPSSADAAVQCPGSVPRRGVDEGGASADALPYIDDAVVDRSDAETALPLIEGDLRGRYSGIVDVVVGPGFGRAWVGEQGGSYAVVAADDLAVVAVLASVEDCPQGVELHVTLHSVPVFFVAVP